MRGSLKVTVKLQFIGNDNPFRDSSAGVQFFSTSTLSSEIYLIQEILGFVVDLVVEDDIEGSSWQDYFRNTVRTSNDNRLKLLYNLSAEVRREVGKKVLEYGGNAVLGYSSYFDIESGLVARAHGTACRLIRVGGSNPFRADEIEWTYEIPRSGLIIDIPAENILIKQFYVSPSPEGDRLSLHPLISFGPVHEQAMSHRGSISIADQHSLFQSEVQLISLRSFDEQMRIRLGNYPPHTHTLEDLLYFLFFLFSFFFYFPFYSP